jgi:predicted DNA-binding transcriptional regulator YafY
MLLLKCDFSLTQKVFALMFKYAFLFKRKFMSSSITFRQIYMLKLVPKHLSFVLTKVLQHQLAEQGFSVSLRTIQCDLEHLSSIMGLTSSESHDGLKWCYLNSATEILPALQPIEALLLCTIKDQLSTQFPMVSLSQLEPRFDKADYTLNCSIKFKNWRDRVKVVSFGFPLTANPINEDIRKSVYDAVLNQQQINLSYLKQPNESNNYLLNAHGLIIRENSHYLVASKNETPNQFQLFKLSKMLEVLNPLDDNQPCTNDIKKYLNSNASGYLIKNEPIQLEMLVTGPALSLLEEASLAAKQSINLTQTLPKRIGKVEVEVEFTQKLVHFLLGFGGYIKVIKPV